MDMVKPLIQTRRGVLEAARRRVRPLLVLISIVTAVLPAMPALAAAPALRVGNVTVTEKDSSGVTARFAVKLSRKSSRRVVVSYKTVAASATAAADYIARSGKLTFKPGVTKKVVAIAVKGDLLDEYDETFKLKLFNPARARIADGVGAAKILDNDLPPQISIADSTGLETNTNSTRLLTIALSGPSGKSIGVHFHTEDGSATTADSDYTEVTDGAVTIPAGETSTTIGVEIVGDLRPEASETFAVILSDPSNALAGDMTATVELTEDDASTGDVVITELMAKPSDTIEWIEFANVTGRPIDVGGWTVDDDTGPECTLSQALIQPGAHRVIADSSMFAGDTELLCAGLVLVDTGDRVDLAAGTFIIDRVDYDSGSGWPTVTIDVSSALDPTTTSATNNDIGSNWCSGPIGGTPAVANATCP